MSPTPAATARNVVYEARALRWPQGDDSRRAHEDAVRAGWQELVRDFGEQEAGALVHAFLAEAGYAEGIDQVFSDIVRLGRSEKKGGEA